ncbi:hypothetical protein [Isoptericola sp. NPDC060257]|uniref:hypothetical protein n=1 Tax=Isoptericola sp. NPDC060257 TaxID=3347087 RepID=UPI00364E372B
MTTVVDLDYTAPGVASGDLANWSGAMQRLAGTSPLCLLLRTSNPGEAASRTVTGLTVGDTYTVSVVVTGFDYPDELGDWTVTVEGQSVNLAVGTASVDFTASAETATLTFTTDTDTSWGIADAYLTALVVGGPDGPIPGAITVTGTTSHLHDEVDIVGDGDVTLATLPAYVGYQTAGIDNSEDGRTAFLESLRVILPACSFDAVNHRIRWRGQLYQSAGPEMLRRRRGRDLTLTVPIKLVTG